MTGADKAVERVRRDVTKFLRRQRGELSFRQFAEVTGFHPEQLRRWEQGHLKRFRLDHLCYLKKLFNCGWPDIFISERPRHRRKRTRR